MQWMKPNIDYVESTTLPTDDKLARKIVMQAEHFTMIDVVWHHIYQQRAKNIDLAKPLITRPVIPKSLR